MAYLHSAERLAREDDGKYIAGVWVGRVKRKDGNHVHARSARPGDGDNIRLEAAGSHFLVSLAGSTSTAVDLALEIYGTVAA